MFVCTFLAVWFESPGWPVRSGFTQKSTRCTQQQRKLHFFRVPNECGLYHRGNRRARPTSIRSSFGTATQPTKAVSSPLHVANVFDEVVKSICRSVCFQAAQQQQRALSVVCLLTCCIGSGVFSRTSWQQHTALTTAEPQFAGLGRG